MSCGLVHRCGLDLVLLWLWHRLAATALMRSLAWELPYAAGVALKRKKDQKKKKKIKGEACFIASLITYILLILHFGIHSSHHLRKLFLETFDHLMFIYYLFNISRTLSLL